MKIVFFSNFLNHHQVLLTDELYKLTDKEFCFVSLKPMFDSFKANGYSTFDDRPYLLKAYESKDNMLIAERLAIDADVAIFGDSSLFLEVLRSKRTNKLSFEVSERWLKKGMKNMLSPRLLKNMFFYHTLFYKKPVYKLCSSAFGAGDQYKLHSFRDRCFKWGYFTNVEDNLDIKAFKNNALTSESIQLMWCARFLKLKHPEIPIKMVARLKAKGYMIKLDMYGSGPELESSKKIATELCIDDIVKFCGNLPNSEILKAMRNHDIFLFTSDKNEGWGAVANEAMSNGCVLVGSDEIGSVPFLINNAENGYVFESCNLDSITEKVENLLLDREKRINYAINGYITVSQIWSPKNAAKNLITLINDLRMGKDTSINEGPCSKAIPII